MEKAFIFLIGISLILGGTFGFMFFDNLSDKQTIREIKCEISSPDAKLSNGYYCGAVGYWEPQMKEVLNNLK
jgi:hypothetical protein